MIGAAVVDCVLVTGALQVQATQFVAYAMQLERWLMEGAFNKVLAASHQPPSDLHAALMTQLAATVRCGPRPLFILSLSMLYCLEL